MENPGHHDARAVWQAAVAAVDSESLVRNCLQVRKHTLHICGQQIPLDEVHHIEVVGAGKAGAGMARAAEKQLESLPPHITWSGQVNVPDDCVEQLTRIRLVGARPAGINEPTEAGVRSTREILHRVSRVQPPDLCLVLLSGGGSALLPAPVPEIPLEDKLKVTRLLSTAGASIQELNTVRSRISDVKAGGLARACGASRLVTLVISDVIGDPLEFIASGPAYVTECPPDDALAVLRRYDPGLHNTPDSVIRKLQKPARKPDPISCDVSHHIIGNNQTALRAAATEAADRGYRVIQSGSNHCGNAADFGRKLFVRLSKLRDQLVPGEKPICLLSGGETTVQLCDEKTRGRGGRNQEIVISAITEAPASTSWEDITLLSGGTDGEDGPTPSAGAIADSQLVAAMLTAGLEPTEFLNCNNAWPFFDRLGGLINTGPTHTNVMDVQVGMVRQPGAA